MINESIPQIGGFADLELVGRGGFAAVYRARDVVLDRQVALKVLNSGESDQSRFYRECRILASLSDIPGVVPVHSAAATTDGRPVIVMAFEPGGSLTQRVDREGVVEVKEALGLGLSLAAALDEAHSRGVFHRDIKPDNVLFSASGKPSLADFGIAKVEGGLSATLTRSSLSPPFAPPERFLEPDESGDRQGDVYSLAATIYFALSGRAPYGTSREGGISGLIARVEKGELPPVPALSESAELFAVLERAMATDPADRYQSAAGLADAISGACETRTQLGAEIEGPVLNKAESPGEDAWYRTSGTNSSGHANRGQNALQGPGCDQDEEVRHKWWN